MTFYVWCVVVGVIFILMALFTTILKRLPISSSMIYLLAGLAIGPAGLALITFHPLDQVELLERIAEVAVLISLFTAGLKLRLPLRNGRWKLPVRLASISMIVTVGLITVTAMWLLNLPLGAAVLLGAVLAPTDPVLASDVQVEEPDDKDHVRFGLTGEAGMNDGTAFPFVMLGLGLLGHHELGEAGWRWFTVDVLWAITGGIGIGALLGTLVGRLVLHLRKEHQEAVGTDNFLALGLIALSYGVALLAVSYGFLAVFAAGLALRRIELQAAGAEDGEGDREVAADPTSCADDEPSIPDEEAATHPRTAPAQLVSGLLHFNEQIERIAEVAVVLLLGGMLLQINVSWTIIGFVALLFLIIRPIAVFVGIFNTEVTGFQRRMIAWFGVRGVGSIYYLMYALNHGISEDRALAEQLVSIVFVTITISIFVHGISVTPLMQSYSQRPEAESPNAA